MFLYVSEQLEEKWNKFSQALMIFAIVLYCLNVSLGLYSSSMDKLYMGPGTLDAENKTLNVKTKNSVKPFYSVSAEFVTTSSLSGAIYVFFSNLKAKYIYHMTPKSFQEVALEMPASHTNSKKTTEIKGNKALAQISKLISTNDEMTHYYTAITDSVKPYVGTIKPSIFKKDTFQGASDGLMKSLEIIQDVSCKDLTKGRKISGTGEITNNGHILPIGALDKKLIAAEMEKAEIFFVPSSMYKEAVQDKKAINGQMKLVPVSTLKEAMEYLQ